MAISFIGNSTSFSDATSGTLTVYRSSLSSGNMMIAFIGGKDYNITITPPSGWTSIGSSTNGTTFAGTDTGSTKIQAFYKIATVFEPSSYGFSISGGGVSAVMMGMLHEYSTTTTWNTPTGTGATNPFNGWANISSSSTLSLPAGAFLPTCFVSNTDATSIGTFPSFSASGRSFGSWNSRPFSAYTTTSGGDGGMVTGYTSISSASNSTPQTVTIFTSGSGSERGHAFIVQLTDAAPTTTTTTTTRYPGRDFFQFITY